MMNPSIGASNATRNRFAAIAAVTTLLAITTGCPGETGISSHPIGDIAVAAGDFDDVGGPLNRIAVNFEQYEGIISTPTWDPDWNWEANQGNVEGLLGVETGGEMNAGYQTVFIASGVRGLGIRQYNSLEPDDHLVTSSSVTTNVRNYMGSASNTLIVTDWAYDLVEVAWPDQIDFLGDDATFDAAQRGVITDMTAKVVDENLAGTLGSDQIALSFNYSNWALIQSVGDDVTVHITGDASYQVESETGDGIENLTDIPLLVSFTPSTGGRVVYSAFHIDAQNAAAIDTILNTIVGDFEGAASERQTF